MTDSNDPMPDAGGSIPMHPEDMDDEYAEDEGICPRCGGPIHRPFFALSRVDNLTEICPGCARKESRWEDEFPQVPLPHVTDPIPYV